jgi:hypothetical protein
LDLNHERAIAGGGNKSSTALTLDRTYRMSCTGAGGTTTIDAAVTVTNQTPL